MVGFLKDDHSISIVDITNVYARIVALKEFYLAKPRAKTALWVLQQFSGKHIHPIIMTNYNFRKKASSSIQLLFSPQTKLKRRRLKLQQEIQEKLSVAEDAERTAGLRGGELPAELWAQARKPVKRLEEEISELQERNAELEQLLQTEDNLRFLQV